MAINLTTLFTLLGHCYKPIKDQHAASSGTFATNVNAAVSALGATYADLGGPILAALPSYQLGQVSGIFAAVKNAMTQVLLRTVNADTPLADKNDLQLALNELRRQMLAQSYKVSAMTIAASASAVSGNTGNGAVVLTTKRADGLAQDNLFAEVGILTCLGDAQNGTATAGSEPFRYRGDTAPASIMGYDYPGASGATKALQAINAAATSPNLITNGTFETYTVANTPDNWTVGTGTPGTDIFSESSIVYAGSKAIKFTGNGSNGPVLRQTLTTLRPNRVYAFNLWTRVSSTLSTAGALRLRFVDGSNSLVTDDQGAGNPLSITLSGLTTSYVAYSGALITPKVLPSTIKFEMNTCTSTDLDNTKSIYVDHLSMAEATYLYPGGPGMGIFGGSIPFMTNDAFDITTTNNQNSASNGATWQRVFDRMFGTRAFQFLLPTIGSTLLNDSLIA